ncbi:MAG: AAA family ATPase [Chloroflexi bacterium]|nr:AAA family ATPase [Chloroflexota bacterium]
MEPVPIPPHLRRLRRLARMPSSGGRRPPTPPQPEPGQEASLEALLNEVATNLTEQLAGGSHTGVYGRDEQIEQVLQTLASPLKGRVILTGEARVGKTAVIHEAVRRIIRGECPEALKGAQVWATSPAAFIGGYPPGNWMGSLDELMTAWRERPEIILYFDDLASATGGPGNDDDGPGPDLALTILAHLRRSTGRMMAEAQTEPWRRFVDRYRDYEKIFLTLRLAVPEADAAHEIVNRVCEDLSVLREISIAPEAVNQAYDLTGRYFLDQFLPGKVIDLIRDSLTVATPTEKATLTSDAVTARFAAQTGLPRILLTDDEPFDDRAVRDFFRTQVLAQEQAVEAIVQSLSLLRARVNNPLRPMGVFLFLGPTGVGKTELARALSTYLYGSPERLVRFNMADYAYPGQQWELFGNPYAADPAARRGQITTRLAGHPFSVIVLDEFEKADPQIFQRFLQLFDEGLMINGAGETINLRNAIFILTSNFGARLIQNERIGFSRGETIEEREARVLAETENYFTPEFMNRIDAVCVFKPLSRTVMGEIARREVGNLLKREGLIRRELEVDIDDDVIEHVVDTGYSQRFGARYLKRQIEKTIAYPLAQQINRRDPEMRGGTIRLLMKQARVASTYLPEVEAETTPTEREAEAGEPRRLTLEEIRAGLPELEHRIAGLERFHNVAAAREERDALIVAMSDTGFWSDQAAARRKLDAFQRASNSVDLVDGMRRALEELQRLCAAERVPVSEAIRQFNFLLRELPRVELTSLLTGRHDTLGAFVQIRAKGRPEAGRKWLRELAQMYLAWAEHRGFAAHVVGEELNRTGTTIAVTLALSGYAAYGLLKGEAGTHRLVQAGVNGGKEDTPQKIAAQVIVWPELTAETEPPVPQNFESEFEVTSQSADHAGLFVKKLTARATAALRSTGRTLSLAGNLPPDDLAHETVKLLWTDAHRDLIAVGETSAPRETSDGAEGLVRTYLRHKERGVRDHRTGLKVANLKKVLEGGLDVFLEAALKGNQN